MGFDLPRLQKCCCCLPLKVGCLVIGYVCLVYSSLSIAATSVSIYKIVMFVNEHIDKPDEEHTTEELKSVALSLYITHAYLLLAFLYYFIISLLLVLGVHLNKIGFMRYYFRTGLFLFCLALASVVVSTVFLHFVATIALLQWCLIIFYCLIVVRSTYLEMEDQRKPPVYEMQNLYNPLRPPTNMYY